MEKNDDYTTVASPCLSPSFSTYSNDCTSQIADRVVSDEEEFEFVTVSSPSNGLIFPVFDSKPILTPLSDLFLRDRHDPPPQQIYTSSDEEEEDELDEIPSEMYCPWTPSRSTADMSPGCRKSKSTGSSSTSAKRWRLRDLLKRSRSDGKQSFKFLNLNPIKEDTSSTSKKKEKVSAHEKFYLRNKAIKEGDKRKSYLPYKQDLFGIFTNVNRSFPHF